MSNAKITLYGAYKYIYDNSGEGLFDLLALPASIDSDTKDAIIAQMLLKGGEMELLYSDPYFVRDSLQYISKKWYHTIDKWVSALNIDYNPLYNYDRREEETNTGSGSGSSEANVTDVRSVSAFDSDDFQGRDKNITNNAGSSRTSTSMSRSFRAFGNIGVTTSQEMLKSEIEVARFNLIEQVSDLFLGEIVIPVY